MPGGLERVGRQNRADARGLVSLALAAGPSPFRGRPPPGFLLAAEATGRFGRRTDPHSFYRNPASCMSVLLQIRDAHKRYGEQMLLDGAEATIVDDVKVGFVGRNGAGKSTLLRVLLGEEELDSGEVVRHPNLRIGYLRQHDPFEPGESALDFLIRDSGQPDWRCGRLPASSN